MRVHLEGMGASGCLLAHQLVSRGVQVTWHDIELPHCAWQASTGAIYPANSTRFGPDWACYLAWRDWHDRRLYRPHVEEGAYWFGHKRPPHEGRYQFEGPTEHGLRRAAVPSLHLNAQSLVQVTRALLPWRLARAPSPADVDHYVVTHGFSHRLSHVYWGWTRLVELSYDPDLYESRGLRPAFYFRPGKYVMAYAYPVPGHKWWYAGSSIIKQSTAGIRELEVEDKYKRWRRDFVALSGGAVSVAREGPFMQGWRPASRDEAWLQSSGNVHALRPLWNSGIRHMPRQWAELARALGLTMTQLEEACL